jgi:hypothetical protein
VVVVAKVVAAAFVVVVMVMVVLVVGTLCGGGVAADEEGREPLLFSVPEEGRAVHVLSASGRQERASGNGYKQRTR